MFGINTGYLEEPVIEHDHAKHAKGDAGRDLYVAHIVYAKASCLLDPVLYERVAQGVLGFCFGQICTFDDETVFASFIRVHGENGVQALRTQFKPDSWNRTA